MPRRPTRRPRGSTRLAFALGMLGCAGCATEPEPEPTAVDVTGPAGRIVVGTSFALTAAVQDGSGPIAGAKVSWTSRDTSTVVVRPDGSGTAVRPGESWVVGQAGSVTDSVLVEVAFAVTDRGGRARIRIAGRESTLDMSQPFGVQSDYLGGDQSDWYIEGGDLDGDTFAIAFFQSAPTGQRTALGEFNPTDPNFPTAPIAFLQMSVSSNVIKLVPLRGFIDVAVVQTVAAGTREGRMRARITGFGRAWTGTLTQSGNVNWAQTQEAFDLVVDALPVFYHDMVGKSSGQLTGTTPIGNWNDGGALFGRSTAQGRNWQLLASGPPNVRVYSPGTVTVDVGSVTETARAYAVVFDSTRGYSGTAATGRLEVTRYTAPPANDLYGEIRGRLTLSGNGGLQGASATPFSGTIDFAAPVLGPAGATAAPAVGRTRSPARSWLKALARTP